MAKQSGTCPECGEPVEYDPATGKLGACPACTAAAGAAAPNEALGEADPLIGQTLGEFEIVALLGRGGMGAVYKAYQPSLGRFVAVKVLSEWLSRDASFVERFHREARAAAAITHPNIIEVHAIGQDKACQYIAMELIEGESLADLLAREGRLSPDRALGIMRDVASALADGHRVGILHRDIKPANILLDARGRVKVADFGLAKQTGVDVTVTAAGQSVGTPLYLPPDVARSGTADARSDLYSLGATFYQGLAGRPPFYGATPAELILKHDQEPVPPLQRLAPETPPALCRIIHRLLRKNPAERYQSAEELLEALSKAGASVAAAMRRPRAARRGVAASLRAHWRRIAVLAALVGGAAALALAIVLALTPPEAEPPAPHTKTPIRPKGPKPEARTGPWKVYTQWPFDAAEAKRRQQAAAAALGVPVEQTIDLGGGIKMTFVLIPAGEFLMGHPDTPSTAEVHRAYGPGGLEEWLKWERPQHLVRISKPFWLGKCEVTQEQWQAVMGQNPSLLKGRPQNPVEQVSWPDCQVFLQKLSARSGKTLRLPTEAEWEYACRAGAATEFHFGDGAAALGDYAWFSANSGLSTQPVGRKKPNAWGLHDMAGNVAEWCQDWYAPYDKGAQTDPKGPQTGGERVNRGGAWQLNALICRSAARGIAQVGVRWPNLGLRVCLAAEPPEQARPTSRQVAGPWKVYTTWPFDAAEANRRQTETAKALGVPVEQDIDLGGGVKMTLVLIPPGEFLMGSPPATSPEELQKRFGGRVTWYQREFPQHRVRISKPFWLGKYEVTQEQWQAVMGYNPSRFREKLQNPVEQLNWNECQQFVRKLSAKLGKTFRLPTEAEWEYASRAGAATAFCFGDSKNSLSDHAWLRGNSDEMTQPAGRKRPNAWALHDMHGNVWEWCQDWHGPYEEGTQTDPEGPKAGTTRLLRGGSWIHDHPVYFRCAFRLHNVPRLRNVDLGFRVARTVDAVTEPPAAAPAPPQPPQPKAGA